VETLQGRGGGTGHEQQGVEPVEGLDRGLDQVRRVVALGEEYAEDQRLAAERADLLLQFLELLPRSRPPRATLAPSRPRALVAAAP
jgi:hypothetical protein